MAADNGTAGKYIKTVVPEPVIGTINVNLKNVKNTEWWLGCTVKVGKKNKEKDLKAQLVKKDGGYVFFYLKGFNEYWVALWKTKVTKKKCKKKYGKACKYCKKNGYHPEDQVFFLRLDDPQLFRFSRCV